MIMGSLFAMNPAVWIFLSSLLSAIVFNRHKTPDGVK